MREGAVLPFLIIPEIPDDRGEDVNGRFYKEFAILLRPGPVDAEEDRLAGANRVGNQPQRRRFKHIAPVRARNVTEIDAIEPGFGAISLLIVMKKIPGEPAERIKFEVIDK
jgi:hypothetical protein